MAGCTAGLTAVLSLHPLDVVKTRLQGAYFRSYANIMAFDATALTEHSHCSSHMRPLSFAMYMARMACENEWPRRADLS